MSYDYDLTRLQTICPFCGEHKEQGLIACWGCFKSSGIKDGDETAVEVLDAFDDILQEIEAANERRREHLEYVEKTLGDFVALLRVQ